MATAHLDGKRTGRPKGISTRKPLPKQLEWVLNNLDNENPPQPPGKGALRMLEWVHANDANRKLFMSRVMSAMLQGPEKKEEKEASLVEGLIDELLAGYKG